MHFCCEILGYATVQKFGVGKIFCMILKQHLFDQKYSKNIYTEISLQFKITIFYFNVFKM